MNKLLEIKNIHIEIETDKGVFDAVSDTSFSMNKGEILGIVGESGCGKSLTSLGIIGLLPKVARVSKGEIYFEGKSLINIGKDDRRSLMGSDISMIYQNPMTSLNPVMKVGKQLTEGIILHKGYGKNEAKMHGVQMLKKVGLPRATDIFDSYPHELSGGMQQRVMIAMAMLCGPKLLIADEPTTALDVTTQYQILKIMKKMNIELGTSIILISHDIGVISKMCDTIVVMYQGEVVEKIPGNSFDQVRHPYTKGLLRCLPSKDKKNVDLYTIPGRVANIDRRSIGCPFSNRCNSVLDKCMKNSPEFFNIGENHSIRCFLYDNEGEKNV